MTLQYINIPTRLICVLLLAAMLIGASHAVVRHGREAELARQCEDHPEFYFYNPQTDRWALICLTDVGKFGVAILDRAGKEITAFIKNKMSRVDEVFRYMSNSGYEFVR